ncbi:MAG: hypothetical protein R6X15_04620 [Pseudomonadota bacterium]
MKALRMMLVSIAAIAVLLGCGASNPTKTEVSAAAKKSPVVIRQAVPYSNTSGASVAVKRECIIDRQLPEFIESYASGYDIAVVRDDKKVSQKNARGKVLELEFSQIYGQGGGAWSGAKSVTVNGTLKENGKTVGSFVGTRVSGGGAFAGYKGTCSILGRCVKILGDDIARWLQSPTMNARLGDAR